MEDQNLNEWVEGMRSLPPDLLKKIRMIELERVLQERTQKKVPGLCGHQNYAQCLAHWEYHFSKINGEVLFCISYWSGLTLKHSNIHLQEIHELSRRCVTLFQINLPGKQKDHKGCNSQGN